MRLRNLSRSWRTGWLTAASVLGMAGAAAAQTTTPEYTENWRLSAQSGSGTFSPYTNANRDMARNPVTGHLLMTRTTIGAAAAVGVIPAILAQTTPAIYVIDAANGQIIDSLNVTGVSGGAVTISDIDVTDDGVIFVGNLTVSAGGVGFKIYSYPSESSGRINGGSNVAPTVALNVAAALTDVGPRLGDSFDVAGTAIGGDLTLYASGNNATSNTAVFRDTDGNASVDFAYDRTISTAQTAAGGLVQITPNGDFYAARNSGQDIFRYGPSAGALVTVGAISRTALNFAQASDLAYGVAGGRTLLVASPVTSGGGGPLAVFDVTDGESNALLSRVFDLNAVGGGYANGNGTGGAGLRDDGGNNVTVFGLKTNNALASFSVKMTAGGPATVLNPGDLVVSEFRTGGLAEGNLTAASNEFVEIYNPTAAPITLNNQSIIQRGNGATADALLYQFNRTNTVTLEPGDHFLLEKNGSTAGGRALPGFVDGVRADAMAVSNTGLSNGGGAVGIRQGNLELGATFPAAGALLDAVGYKGTGAGTGTFVEGTALTFAPDADHRFERKPGVTSVPPPAGSTHTDTNDNAADFLTFDPTTSPGSPQNTASPANPAPVPTIGTPSQTALAFSGRPIGTTSAPQTTTVSFSGLTAPLTATLSGANAADFTVTPTSVPGDTTSPQTFTITFSPTDVGTRSATLTFSSPGASNQLVALVGLGQLGDFTFVTPPTPVPGFTKIVNPADGDDPVVGQWTPSAGATSYTFYVLDERAIPTPIFERPVGNATSVTVSEADLQTLLILAGIEPGETTTVYYYVVAEGPNGTTRRITEPDSSRQLRLTNGSPGLTASPASLAFGQRSVNTTSPAQQVTVTFSGLTGPITATITGPDADQFAVMPTSIPANATSPQTLDVTFTPTTAGTKSATLVLSSPGAVSRTVTLSGSGIGLARLQLIAESADPSLALVDLYLDGVKIADNLAFRAATAYLNVTAGLPIKLAVAPSTSTDSSQAFYRLTTTLPVGSTNQAVVLGVRNPALFAPNPSGRSTAVTIKLLDNARETSTSAGDVQVRILHGVTDLGSLDVRVADGGATLLNDALYTDASGTYLTLAPGTTTLDVTSGDGLTTYQRVRLTAGAGQALTLVIDGFFVPAVNQNGAALAVVAYGPNAGPGTILPTAPVPVELASFTGHAGARGVVELAWTTATETNNAGFSVQRRSGETWTELAFVSGNGTTVEARSYRFTDRTATGQTQRYRLVQRDLDGTTEVGPEISVSIDQPTAFALLPAAPNPFNPTTALAYELPVGGRVLLVVYDGLGREVAHLVDEPKAAGRYEARFDGAGLASGLYVARLTVEPASGARQVRTVRMTLVK